MKGNETNRNEEWVGNDNDDLAGLDEEIEKMNKELYKHLLQPPRRILSGELIPNAKIGDDTEAFIEKKKAELNVDDWPPKYRGWVPSDELVEEFRQFCRAWRVKKYGEEN